MDVENRLQKMYKEYAEECECEDYEVPGILIEEWGEGGDRGYGMFGSDDTEVLHIQKIDELDIYDSDLDAAEQAEKDGIKLIHDIEIPNDSILYPLKDTFVDIPSNRRQLLEELQEEMEDEEEED